MGDVRRNRYLPHRGHQAPAVIGSGEDAPVDAQSNRLALGILVIVLIVGVILIALALMGN